MKKYLKYIFVAIIIVVLIALFVLKKSSDSKLDSSNLFSLYANKKFNKENIINKGYITIIDIGDSTCGACKDMHPILEELNKDLKNKVIVKFIDYWKYPKLVKQFEFKVTPTQYFYYNDGTLYKIHEGVLSKNEFILILKEMGYRYE